MLVQITKAKSLQWQGKEIKALIARAGGIVQICNSQDVSKFFQIVCRKKVKFGDFFGR